MPGKYYNVFGSFVKTLMFSVAYDVFKVTFTRLKILSWALRKNKKIMALIIDFSQRSLRNLLCNCSARDTPAGYHVQNVWPRKGTFDRTRVRWLPFWKYSGHVLPFLLCCSWFFVTLWFLITLWFYCLSIPLSLSYKRCRFLCLTPHVVSLAHRGSCHTFWSHKNISIHNIFVACPTVTMRRDRSWDCH